MDGRIFYFLIIFSFSCNTEKLMIDETNNRNFDKINCTNNNSELEKKLVNFNSHKIDYDSLLKQFFINEDCTKTHGGYFPNNQKQDSIFYLFLNSVFDSLFIKKSCDEVRFLIGLKHVVKISAEHSQFISSNIWKVIYYNPNCFLKTLDEDNEEEIDEILNCLYYIEGSSYFETIYILMRGSNKFEKYRSYTMLIKKLEEIKNAD